MNVTGITIETLTDVGMTDVGQDPVIGLVGTTTGGPDQGLASDLGVIEFWENAIHNVAYFDVN